MRSELAVRDTRAFWAGRREIGMRQMRDQIHSEKKFIGALQMGVNGLTCESPRALQENSLVLYFYFIDHLRQLGTRKMTF